jgi:hypothetical protein
MYVMLHGSMGEFRWLNLEYNIIIYQKTEPEFATFVETAVQTHARNVRHPL